MRKTTYNCSIFMLGALLLSQLGSAAAEAEAPLPEMRPCRAAVPPRIDGDLSDEVWRHAPETTPFVNLHLPRAARERTTVRTAYDDKNLYVAFICDDPQTAAMMRMPSSGREYDGSVYEDDCVEIYLTDPRMYTDMYHFVVNYRNVRYDSLRSRIEPYKPLEKWNGLWQSAVKADGKRWFVEIAIPWYVVNVMPGQSEARINFCREKQTLPGELSCWSCTYGDFHKFERFGKLKGLTITAPQVQITELKWPQVFRHGVNRLELELTNTARTRVETGLLLHDASGKNLANGKYTLEPGAKRRVNLDFQLDGGKHYLLTLAATTDGKSYNTAFRNAVAGEVMELRRHMPIAVNTAPLAVKIHFSDPAAVSRLECVATGGSNRELFRRTFPVKASDMTFELPLNGIKAGDYTITWRIYDKKSTLLKTEQRAIKVVNHL